VGFDVEGVGSEFFDELLFWVLVVEREVGRKIYSIDISRFDAQDGDDFDGGAHVCNGLLSGALKGGERWFRRGFGWISRPLYTLHPF
jgi:hypothetical protein